VSWGFLAAIPFQIQGAAISALILLSHSFKNIGYYEQSNFIDNNIIILAIVIVMLGFIVNFFRLEGIITPITFVLTCVLVVLFLYYVIPLNASDCIGNIYNSGISKELHQIPEADVIGFILGCSVLTFSYGGVTFGQHGGEECKDDFSRGIIRAIVIALGTCILIYFLISFFLYRAVPWRYIAVQANINSELNALNIVVSYMPKKVITLMYFFLAIAVIDNIFTLGFRAIRMAVAFSRDGILSHKLAKPVINGPGFMACVVYFITIIITIFIHYERLAILANFSYSLGLIITSLMVFKVKNRVEIFGSNKRLLLFKFISIFCMIFYFINLAGIIAFLPDMTIWWFALILLGIIIYYLPLFTKRKHSYGEFHKL
jgi:amino acid transporter